MMRRLKQLMAPEAPRKAADGQHPTAQICDASTAEYWTSHNVSQHRVFRNADESLAYFTWRNHQYFDYIELMPVDVGTDRVVLDYGCGPGHDLVGFSVHSQPSRLLAMDVSPSSLTEAEARLALHGGTAEFVLLSPRDARLPLPDSSVDYIHCSGVLHHVPNPDLVLSEFLRVLKRGGECRIMVYNYFSIWMHLYVAYHKRIVEGVYAGLDLMTSFARSTDGENCPISRVYQPQEFVGLCVDVGFTARFTGAAIAAFEAGLAATRFNALMDERLPEESRTFLAGLTFDGRLLPMHGGTYAGVDACFYLQK